jgi:hypothetical protein
MKEFSKTSGLLLAELSQAVSQAPEFNHAGISSADIIKKPEADLRKMGLKPSEILGLKTVIKTALDRFAVGA